MTDWVLINTDLYAGAFHRLAVSSIRSSDIYSRQRRDSFRNVGMKWLTINVNILLWHFSRDKTDMLKLNYYSDKQQSEKYIC